MSFRRTLLAAILCLSPTALAGAAEPGHFDVVVYGATPGGVVAAQAAAKEGVSVVLLEPERHVGGMMASGLGDSDVGNPKSIGGLARAVFARIAKRYGIPMGQSPSEPQRSFRFEPHVAEEVFTDILAEAKVPVLFRHRLHSVRMDGRRIRAVELEDGSVISAAVFIDASYEGDLMARAGVDYRVGREGRNEFGESLAGIQPVDQLDAPGTPSEGLHQGPGHSSLTLPTLDDYRHRRGYLKSHQWPVRVSGLDAEGNLLPTVTGRNAGPAGQGDKKFMAYNFRLCLTDRAENRIPISPPPGYDPRQYELLARYLERWPDITLEKIIFVAPMPNAKSDFNSSGPFSTDVLGLCWDYPEADHSRRRAIWQAHKAFLQGMFYFLGHDPRVPSKVREEMLRWGLCKDEFVDNDHWPWQLYIRVARRMQGAFVMTQKDILADTCKPDSVGLGSCIIDSHNVQRVLRADGSVINEGGIEVPEAPRRPYGVPYRVLTPRPGQCENLLVPVCCSASYVAYCSMRMEAVYMILGQASGVAAATAARCRASVQEVDGAAIRRRLREQGQILEWLDPPVK